MFEYLAKLVSTGTIVLLYDDDIVVLLSLAVSHSRHLPQIDD